ncbi:MAG: PD-(D/E)XK nuclease family transposase [Bacteroidales bacterium]|nr:PD-(D/E)XK nuclease family transposase [Bacteroidales bacterium]
MAKYLDPKADLTFKKVFGKNKRLVMSLLNALLPLPDDMKITDVEYLSSENIPENPAKKYPLLTSGALTITNATLS